MIPGEIAYKICEKIKQKKKFHAYVVLSMFPQGDPASEFVQQQLYYQFLTLEMIMRKITVQIKLAGKQSRNQFPSHQRTLHTPTVFAPF